MFFSKYVGSGNDFILIDNRDLFFPDHDHETISKLCNRQCGIGADGLILLENSKTADFKMRIFNSDGSQAEMCGNGIRCLFKFIQECNETSKNFLIETKEAQIAVSEDSENPQLVKVAMQEPFDMQWNLDLCVDSNEYKVHFLNTGVPHAVIFSNAISDADLKEIAPKIRYHERFLPKGTNVNFVCVTGKNALNIRTYERGVENETLGCGTGATASAIAAAYLLDASLPITVKTKSGEELKIDCMIHESAIKNVTMTGPALFVYKGELKVCSLAAN